MGGGIGREFKRLGLKPSALIIFLYLQDEASSNEDGRAACSPRYLAEELDYTEKVVRNSLLALVEYGYITLETKSRLYTMVSICDRRKGAAKGAEKGAGKTYKNQYDLIDTGAEKGAAKGATGVTAVRRSSGVDVVVDVDSTEDLGKPRATPQNVHKSKPTAKARYETAEAKAPQLPDVVMHINRIYSDLSGGHKYPWSGSSDAASILAALIVSHKAPLVMAAAERYFVKGNAWIEERAWAIDEFAKQFARLIATAGITKRAAQIATELQEQTLPSTPAELKANFAAVRRRQQEPIEQYDPSEVRFREDMREHAAKAAVGV